VAGRLLDRRGLVAVGLIPRTSGARGERSRRLLERVPRPGLDRMAISSFMCCVSCAAICGRRQRRSIPQSRGEARWEN
jgi:hypothetical protein